MRSLIVHQDYIPDPENYSDLQVLQPPGMAESNNMFSWYLGTIYSDGSPGSRDTGYMTKLEAEKLLEHLENGNLDPEQYLRHHP